MVEIYLNPEHETNWDEVALDQRPLTLTLTPNP